MDEHRALPPGPYLTIEELADRWHTTPNAIRIRRHRRTAPPGYREGARLLFPLSGVEAHEAARQAADSRFNTDLDPTRKPVRGRNSRRRTAPAA
jgi:hypothetical protein